jgi:hypothetical protein
MISGRHALTFLADGCNRIPMKIKSVLESLVIEMCTKVQ